MERKIVNMLAITATALLVGCTANPAPSGKAEKTVNVQNSASSVYNQQGMEISKIVSSMSDTLHTTLINDLRKDLVYSDDPNAPAPTYSIPKVAITSFVDTDTYENSGYLGKAVAEMFVHELDRRGIGVFEYKLTGAITITKDGEFVFSRDWKKVAKKAMVKHILAGTLTRNDKGIVLLGRIINMQTHTVVGSTTGFVPYEKLPYCYRTAKKDCQLYGVNSYLYEPGSLVVPNGKSSVIVDRVTKRTIVASASYKVDNKTQKEIEKQKIKDFKDNYYSIDLKEFNSKYYPKGAEVPATSAGNYQHYMYNKEHSFLGAANNGKSPVIYPAETYKNSGKLVRDVHDKSQYSRTND